MTSVTPLINRRPDTDAAPVRILRIELKSHLTELSLSHELHLLETRMTEPVAVLIDCRQMTDYDLAARHAFVAWHARNRARIERVAVLTDNRLWWMIISAMSLASGMKMKGIAGETAAMAWLRSGFTHRGE